MTALRTLMGNISIRLSWILVLSAFLVLLLVTGGLGLYAAEQASPSVRLGIIACLVAAVLVSAAALWGISANVIRPMNEAIACCERMSMGDLTLAIDRPGNNEIGRLFSSMAKMQKELSDTVGVVRKSGQTIYAEARDIAAGNQDLSSRTEQQAASLQQTAASMEELSSTVVQTPDNAGQASQLANSASITAK